MKFDKNKSAEMLSDIMKSTKAISKRATETAKNSVAAMVEKSHNDSYERRMKKYNPLFMERYQSKEFNLPNMIMIVDDAVRRGVDVCEGAIGWLGNEAGMEIMYLYDEAVQLSGLKFVPVAACDAVYYVDSFDRSRFIRTDYIFSKAHEEKIAELKHIAYALGAKRCTIEIQEVTTDQQTQSKKMKSEVNYKGAVVGEEYESSATNTTNTRRSGRVEVEFAGSDEPQKPELKWFAHDDNINRLIEMRFANKNAIKTETLELTGESSATMSQKIAYAIDGVMSKLGGAKGHKSMNAQAAKESQSRLIYIIEF